MNQNQKAGYAVQLLLFSVEKSEETINHFNVKKTLWKDIVILVNEYHDEIPAVKLNQLLTFKEGYQQITSFNGLT